MIRELFTYRGREGYWMWILHRVTGVAIFLFLLAHIVDTMLVFWPPLYNAVVAFYTWAPMHALEIVLVGVVIFHAVNGLRIIAVDFWTESTRRRRELFWAAMALFALMFIPSAIRMSLEMVGRH